MTLKYVALLVELYLKQIKGFAPLTYGLRTRFYFYKCQIISLWYKKYLRSKPAELIFQLNGEK